jgi:hypothetical protein
MSVPDSVMPSEKTANLNVHQDIPVEGNVYLLHRNDNYMFRVWAKPPSGWNVLQGEMYNNASNIIQHWDTETLEPSSQYS